MLAFDVWSLIHGQIGHYVGVSIIKLLAVQLLNKLAKFHQATLFACVIKIDDVWPFITYNFILKGDLYIYLQNCFKCTINAFIRSVDKPKSVYLQI